MIGAFLFTWLQGAGFYYDLHKQAVDTLPPGDGKKWVDVGCGPGLIARLAAAKNYKTLGLDTDPSMIRMAQGLALWEQSNAKFAVGDLGYLDGQQADVVSAASLLVVVPDQVETLKNLWNTVKPGGHLLVIEPTDLMTTENAKKAINAGLPKKRVNGLRVWAKAREGRIIDPDIFDPIQTHQEHCLPLLHGLVKAWIFEKQDPR